MGEGEGRTFELVLSFLEVYGPYSGANFRSARETVIKCRDEACGKTPCLEYYTNIYATVFYVLNPPRLKLGPLFNKYICMCF